MAEKDFDAEFADLDVGDGHTFTLKGQPFRTKAVAPPKAFLDDTRGLGASVAFLDQVLVPEDREKFHALIDDENSGISAYQIDQIAVWLIGETSGRPTK